MQAGGSHRGEEHRFLDAAKALPWLMNAVIRATLFLLGPVFEFLLKGKTLQVCKSFFLKLFQDTGRLPISLLVLFTCLLCIIYCITSSPHVIL